MATPKISTQEIGVNTNYYELKEMNNKAKLWKWLSQDQEKLSILERKVLELERKLLEANSQINNLTNELSEEKAKNKQVSISTASDETKKIDSGSFEKEISFKSTKLICRTTKPPLKRYKSSEVNFKNEFNRTKDETAEDAEFEKLEALAISEAKADSAFALKSTKEIIQDTMHELKSTGQSIDLKRMNKKANSLNSKRKLTEGNSPGLENEYLKVSKYKSLVYSNAHQ